MKKILALIMSAAMALSLASCGGGSEGEVSSEANTAPTKVTVKYIMKDGTELASNEGELSAGLTGGFKPESGSIVRVLVENSSYVAFEAFGLSKAILYLPEGSFDYVIPELDPQRVYPPNTFGKDFVINASIPTAEELKAEQNLALNPYDLKDSTAFPHAKANNTYANGNDPDFIPRNAIDGFTQNTGHGRYPVQSWGPDRKNGLEFTVDLGSECVVSSVTVYVRADFPHDIAWSSCDIYDSNGNLITKAELKQVSEGQTFTFASPVTTSSIVFKNMVSTDMNKWSGFTEIQVNGHR